MRTIISGPVTPEDLTMAGLFVGIMPSALVSNGAPSPSADIGLPVTCYPVDKALGILGEAARDYTLVQNADALVVAGQNDHLVKIARQYGLLVHQACIRIDTGIRARTPRSVTFAAGAGATACALPARVLPVPS